MSMYIRSFAILGVEINVDKLSVEGEVRGCSCDITKALGVPSVNNPNFCPVCGDRFMNDEDVDIDGFDRDNEKLHGLDVIFNSSGDKAFVGALVSASDMRHKTDVGFQQFTITGQEHIIPRMRELLCDKLGHIDNDGFYNAEKFGLYSITHCS